MNLFVKTVDWTKRNPLFTGLIALAIVAVVWYFGGSIKQKILDFSTDRKVEKLEKQADDSQQKANAEISEAAKASGARAAEDERRRTEILPAIQRGNGNREQARLNTQKAQSDYENSKRNPGNVNPDLHALHERNSADFCQLYPEDCR
jgi:outer membrane murein-binding lipoprotein Lpp